MTQTRLLERLSAQDHHYVSGDDFGCPQDAGLLAFVDASRLLDGDGQARISETYVRRLVAFGASCLPSV